VPENPICENKDLYISFRTDKGFLFQKSVTSSDLSIKTPESIDPYDGTITDGGKLRPLSSIEQRWIFETLKEIGNTEVYIILMFMVMTGARIQTACTLRLRHFENPNPPVTKFIAGGYDIVKLKAGPGTGIDTKFSKSGLLMVPKALYDLIHTYLQSNRARHRYELNGLGLQAAQYLFLTKQGAPYFEAKEFTTVFDPNFKRRHFKKGGTVRQFLKDTLIPLIRERHDKKFSFRVHDLRATYGMNTEAVLIEMVHVKKITMDKARQILCALMWHKSASTTDHYLNYRALTDAAAIAVDDYGLQVQEWISMAKKGFSDEL
jgi:integrase